MVKTVKHHKRKEIDLKQIGIVITRPYAQSQEIIDRVQKHNGVPLVIPCLEIDQPTNTDEAKNVCQNEAHQYDYWLFTSPNSVQYALDFGLSFTSTPCIAIGLGTKKILGKQISTTIIQAAKPYTSEALIETLKTVDIKDKKILIFSGEGGRRVLGDALFQLGALPNYIDVYRRKKPENIDLSALLKHSAQHNIVLLISSFEAFTHYHETAQQQDPYYLNRHIIVASERLKDHINALGYTHITIAASAYPLDLWNALCKQINNIIKIDQTQTLSSLPLLQSKSNIKPTEELFMSNNEHEISTAQESIPVEKKPVQEELPIAIQPQHTQTKSGGNGIALIALIFGLAGIGASGYNFWATHQIALPQENNDEALLEQIATLKTQLQSISENQSKIEKSIPKEQFDPTKIETTLATLTELPTKVIPDLQATNGELRAQLDRINKKQEEIYTRFSEQDKLIVAASDTATASEQLVHSLQTKLTQNLIEQKSALKNVDELAIKIKNTTDLNALNIAETHYLIKLATYKLRFESDIQASTEALNLAFTRLNEVDDPKFTETKNRIQENIAFLSQNKSVDRELITKDILKITSLLPELKLKSDDALDLLKEKIFSEAAKEKQEHMATAPWYKKLFNEVKPLFITKQERLNAPELMAFEDASYLKQNIQLQLSAARLAVLQNQPETYKQSLSEVRAWINKYYSDQDAKTHDVIAKLDELLGENISPELPDIVPTLKSFEAAMRIYQGEGI